MKISTPLSKPPETVASTMPAKPKYKTSCSSELAILCGSYTVAAANEYWIVNWLKMYGVNLPIFFALVQNASWPIQMVFYNNEIKKLEEPRVITRSMYKSYVILGLLAAFISLTRMFGLSALPPTLYVICANTEIVFETMMTKFILKKKVSWLQIAAVMLVIAGVVVALYDPTTKTFGGSGSDDSNQDTIFIGVGLSLASRFASSLNTILAEKFLGKDAKSKVGVNECAVANSVIPFFVIPVAFSFNSEYKNWHRELFPSAQSVVVIITFLCIALCVSKHIDRLSKFGIVSSSSTIFFAGVDAAMKMVAGIGSFMFFGEKITWANVLGFGLVGVSVFLLYLDKKRTQAKAKKAKENAAGSAEVSKSDGGSVVKYSAVPTNDVSDASENPLISVENEEGDSGKTDDSTTLAIAASMIAVELIPDIASHEVMEYMVCSDYNFLSTFNSF